jgi:hypothetical protein
MSIKLRCPQPACGKALTLRDEWAGKKVKCPACGSALVAPKPAAPAGGEPAAPARSPAPEEAVHPAKGVESVSPTLTPAPPGERSARREEEEVPLDVEAITAAPAGRDRGTSSRHGDTGRRRAAQGARAARAGRRRRNPRRRWFRPSSPTRTAGPWLPITAASSASSADSASSLALPPWSWASWGCATTGCTRGPGGRGMPWRASSSAHSRRWSTGARSLPSWSWVSWWACRPTRPPRRPRPVRASPPLLPASPSSCSLPPGSTRQRTPARRRSPVRRSHPANGRCGKKSAASRPSTWPSRPTAPPWPWGTGTACCDSGT